MKISIVGLGYVGLSNALLLARHNKVVAYDIVAEKVQMLQSRMSPIVDPDIQSALEDVSLNFKATSSCVEAFKEAEFIVIATPTNYDADSNKFDTSSVEASIALAREVNTTATIV
ncbi:MAG: UDP-glucose 6-dehydrogenase, partial [Burkholderiales bacterium]|nr:UDP-glucose 6-dehydrogenase [Burkholderiales bacterium]